MVKTPAQMAVDMTINIDAEKVGATIDSLLPHIQKLLDMGLSSGDATALTIELMRAE